MMPDDMPRGTFSRGGEDRGRLPQLTPLRGDNMNTGHRLPQFRSTRTMWTYFAQKLSIIDPVFTCVLELLFLLVGFDTKTCPCKMYVL